MSKSTIVDVIGDRRNLERQTSLVRIVAFVDFSYTLLVLFIISFFFGFTSMDTTLFLLDISHFLVAGAAGYGGIRLGYILYVAGALAALALILDFVQLLMRVFGMPLTLQEFIFIVAVALFIVLDVLELFGLVRLLTADRQQNQLLQEHDRRSAILNQEANTVRLTGVFDIVASLFLFLFILVFVGFNSTPTALTLWGIGHIPVALYAIFVAAHGGYWMIAMLLLGFLLLILDIIEIVERFTSLPTNLLGTFSLSSLFSLLLIFINICFILISLMYIIASFGWLYASQWEAESGEMDSEIPADVRNKISAVTVSSTTSDDGSKPLGLFGAYSVPNTHKKAE